MSEETVTISRKEYAQLQQDSDFLQALQDAGVDNWEGYSRAWRAVDSEDEDD